MILLIIDPCSSSGVFCTGPGLVILVGSFQLRIFCGSMVQFCLYLQLPIAVYEHDKWMSLFHFSPAPGCEDLTSALFLSHNFI